MSTLSRTLPSFKLNKKRSSANRHIGKAVAWVKLTKYLSYIRNHLLFLVSTIEWRHLFAIERRFLWALHTPSSGILTPASWWSASKPNDSLCVDKRARGIASPVMNLNVIFFIFSRALEKMVCIACVWGRKEENTTFIQPSFSTVLHTYVLFFMGRIIFNLICFLPIIFPEYHFANEFQPSMKMT